MEYLDSYLSFSSEFTDFMLTGSSVMLCGIWFSLFMLFTLFLRIATQVSRVNRSAEAGEAYRAAYAQWRRDKESGIDNPEPSYLQWDRPTLLTLTIRRVGFWVHVALSWLRLFLSISVFVGFGYFLFSAAKSSGDFGKSFLLSFVDAVKEPSYTGSIVGGAIAGYAIGRLLSFFAVRYLLDFSLSPWLNERDQRVAVKSKSRTGETSDVRTLSLPEHIDFDPLDYFAAVNDQDAMFLGVTEDGQPIGLRRDVWVKSNVQVMGPPGTGKGVQASVVMAQALRNFDDAVIVFDPKNDEWAPHVLRNMAKRFVLVDLRRGKPAQINPFWKITPDHLFELFVAGFSLGTKGTDADHYRLGDRKAAYLLSQSIGENGATVFELLEAAKALPDDVRKNAEGLIGQLEELSHIEAIQAAQGVDIADVIANGGCLYFIGAMRDDSVIRLQKMLFVRVIQLVESRSTLNKRRQVTIFLDEVKYLLSAPSINALGTVRDKACNIILAHQSLGDFASAGADLDPDAVKTSILDNTPLKWIYRVKAFDTATWVSEQTGEIVVDVEQRTVNRHGAIEMIEGETRLSKERRFLIDTNTIQNLPIGCAVCIGAGAAHLAFANPIRVAKEPIRLIEADKACIIPVIPPVESSPETTIIDKDDHKVSDDKESLVVTDNKNPTKVEKIGNSKSSESLEDFF
ncbi:type IV secretory system conjugative DNA transfer family protein [Salmonella enterica subsp. enterica serovar Bareilly]|uniref:type IV secretory system conjugative DNA transfer family protein n=1 Tax=Aeromonas veronii TaxID=654 RepID=UPI003D223DC3